MVSEKWLRIFKARRLVLLTVGILVVALLAPWLGPLVQQRQAVRAWESAGAEVYLSPRGPEWLRERLMADLRIRGIDRVVGIKIQGGPLTNEHMAHLELFRNLEILEIRDCRGIDDRGLKHLSKLPMLLFLDLRGSNVGDEGMRHLASVPNLRSLYLDGTLVTDRGLIYLSRAPELLGVNLGNTDVSDAGIAHLARFPKLRSVSIANTRVTDAGFLQLMGFPNMSDVTIGSQISHSAIQEFLKSRQARLHFEPPP